NSNYSIKSIYINNSKRVFAGIDVSGSNSFIYWFDLASNIYTDNNGFSTTSLTNGLFTLDASGITAMDGFINDTNTGLWITYGSNIALINIDNSTPPASQTITQKRSLYSYKTVSILASNNIVMAAGNNIISTSNNGGVSWTDVSLSGTAVNKIYVLDASNALAVGNAGTILMSLNRGASWTQVPSQILNSSGNANRLIDTNGNLTNIGVVDSNNFYIVKSATSYVAGSTQANTSLFHAYLPNLFNNTSNYVLDVSGSVRLSGDMNVNDGGKIASNNRVFELLNAGVNQVNFAGDAEFVRIGNKTNSTVIANSALNVLQDSSLNGNLIVGGNATINQKLGVLSDTSLNANLFVLRDTSMNGNLSIGINANVGGLLTVAGNTLLKSNLRVLGNMSIDGNANINGEIVVSGNALLRSNLIVLENSRIGGNLVV
ncbi:hypothetical protein EB093_09635, partial [bacterium]|nr:hypothetical protein [bacterium]